MKKVAYEHTYRFLKILYLFRYFGDAFFYTFLYVFLASNGFNNFELGLVSAFTPLAALIGSIFFARIAKNVNINRILMVISSFVEFGVALLFALIAPQSFIFYLVIITLISFFNVPFYTLLDGYSGTYIMQAKKQYSAMRIMGTISYVIGPLLGAILMEFNLITYATLFYMSAFFLLLTFVMTVYLPKQTINEDVIKKEKLILRDHPELLIYYFFGLFIIALSIVSDNFFGVFLTEERLISDATYGYLVAATIFVELLVFIFIIYKKNMFRNPAFSYFLIGSAILMRPLAIALNLPTNVIFIFSLFRGIAWGYYIVFNVLYLARIVPLTKLTGALFIMQITVTFGRIISSLVIGKLLESFSYQNVFIGISVLVVLATTTTVILSVNLRHKKMRLSNNLDAV